MSYIPKIGLDLGACHFRVLSDKDRRHNEPGRLEVAVKSQRFIDRGPQAKALGKVESLGLTPMTGSGHDQEELLARILRRLIAEVSEARCVFRPQLVFALRDSRLASFSSSLEEAAFAAGAASSLILPASAVASSAIGYGPSGIFFGLDMGWSHSGLILRDKEQLIAQAQIPIAGRAFDRAIERGIAEEIGLFISPEMRFRLKSQALSLANASERLLLVAGRSLQSGQSDRASIESGRLNAWIDPELDRLTEHIVRFLHELPDHHRFFLQEEGLWLYGGCACMEGLQKALADRLTLPVRTGQDPSRVLLRGLGRILSKI